MQSETPKRETNLNCTNKLNNSFVYHSMVSRLQYIPKIVCEGVLIGGGNMSNIIMQSSKVLINTCKFNHILV